MRRFFFSPQQRHNDIICLSAEESKHITKVLRLQPGKQIELLDGSNKVYTAEIIAIGQEVQAQITGTINQNTRPQTNVRIAQGVLKGQKMDMVIQKCTELGADLFIPFTSSRCQGKLDEQQTGKKQERWQRIAFEACKQCMRPQPMVVIEPVDFQSLIRESSQSNTRIKLLFWEEEHQTHLQDLQPLTEYEGVDIILGPEGGITPEEVALAQEHGWIVVSLGSRILRAETATIAALTLVQYLSGNLS